MEIQIAEQGLQFLLAGLTGLSMGCIYDLFRALRRTVRGLTWLLDLLFGSLLLFGNLLLLLYVGEGEYRIFFLVASTLGFGLWMWILSPLLLPLMCRFWRLLLWPFVQISRFFKKIIEKMKLFLKKDFSKRKKSVKIKKRHSQNGGESGARS
ncbi:MAG: hypothetical protein J6K89_06650 [Oscillospiraceae bacterium]|nr:hypothetical protein [Oscillospiraceae bacterium]